MKHPVLPPNPLAPPATIPPVMLTATQTDLYLYLDRNGAPPDGASGVLGAAFPMVRNHDISPVHVFWQCCHRPYSLAIYHTLRSVGPRTIGHAAALIVQRFADAPEVDRETALLRYIVTYFQPVDGQLTSTQYARTFDDANPRWLKLRDQ